LSITVLLSLLLLALLLIGCGGIDVSEGEEASASPSDNVEIALADEVAATAMPTVTPVVTIDLVPVDYCLDCHTNKEMLIDTADPEEEVISENEGEG